MFDKNFYPTPREIALKMCHGVDFNEIGNILEPSAGKGDILEYLDKVQGVRSDRLYCMEINRDLQFILKEKGYKLIGEDFLRTTPEHYFDFIIMNPPFDNGVLHLLHAFEISHGAEIRCLLNEETLKNPCTKERRLLCSIIEQNGGEIEYLGPCFKDSEHKTGAGVALVRLRDANTQDPFEFDMKRTGCEKPVDINLDDIGNNLPAKADMFASMEDLYNKVKELHASHTRLVGEIFHYAKLLLGEYDDVHKMIAGSITTKGKESHTAFCDEFRKACWNNVLHRTKIGNMITESVRRKFHEFEQHQGYLPFNKENIENLFYELALNAGNIMNSCIIEAFELMTKYHKENRVYFEGWKTNDCWKVNKTVILPYAIDSDALKWNNSRPRFRYEFKRNTIADIEKALAFISGRKFECCSGISKINEENLSFGRWHDSEFFEFSMFKKGTIHLRFKDMNLHERFNLIACRGKNWLPPGKEEESMST